MASTAVDLHTAEHRSRATASSPAATTATASVRAPSGDPASANKKPSAAPGDKEPNAIRRRAQRKKEDDTFSYMNLLPLALIAVAYVAIRVPAAQAPPRFNWRTTEYVYAFGDSYTYVQGTAGRANFSFIGDAFDLSFSPEQLLSNEIVPHFTSSDGSNWIEFLTGCLAGKPADCAPHQLWDFAFAGADIDPTILPLHHNFSVDLVGEVQQWAAYAAHVVPHPPERTLTAWWIGINDTGDSFRNASITDWTLFWHAELRSYFNAVELAYNKGLHGTHLFLTVPPGERAPARAGDTEGQALLKRRIREFNTILSGYVDGFARRHPRVNVLTFDAHAWFEGVLDDAAAYGFTDTTGFCQCSDPTFFWYDDGHPTERVHKLLAQAVEAQLLAASEPSEADRGSPSS